MLTIGLDIGTTSVKAALIDTDPTVRVIAQQSRRYATARPRPGFAEQDPADWWRCVGETVRDLPRLREVVAVAVSGQGSTVCLCDETGRALGPAIGWQDQRAVEEAREIDASQRVTLDQAHGNQIGDAPEPKLLWLARHDPDRLGRASLALSAAGVVGAALGAGPSISIGDAASFLSFDHHSETWSPALSDALAVSHLLPSVDACGAAIGTISPAAAAHTGLRLGVPIVATTTDVAAAAIAAGAGMPGEVFFSKGTGGFVCAHVAGIVHPGRMAALPVGRRGITQLCATIDSLGSAWDWARALLGGIENDDAEALAAQAPSGSNGLIVIPWLSGAQHPVLEPDARGVVAGLSLETDRGTLLRALLEGTSAMLRANLDAAEAASNVRFDQVVSSGGPTRNRLWNELDAAAAGIPVVVAPDSNAAIGAALIACEAAGGCDDALAAGRALRGAGEKYLPDPVLADSAEARVALAGDLGDATLPLMRRLGAQRRDGTS